MASVLVVDDEPAVRNVLVQRLQREGHDASAASSAREGLAYALGHPVDVVVTDMFMPDEDGFELLAALRRQLPGVVVIAMSGGGAFGQTTVLEAAAALGAVPILKPVTMADLRAVLARVAAKSEGPAPLHPPETSQRPFLPFAVAPPDELQAMAARVASAELVATLNALPGMVLILNLQRQAVFANRAACARLGLAHSGEAVGRRPGDLMGCAHAAGNACGTTDSCRQCGAAQALAGALKRVRTEMECRILPEHAGGELNLRVLAQPFAVGDDELLLVAITDVANEKRREALEAMFFHDVLNTAGGIRGLTQIIQTSPPDEARALQRMLDVMSAALVDEIEQQRGLLQAERGELPVRSVPADAHALLATVAALYSTHPAAKGKDIVVEPGTESLPFVTDPTLIGRVLGNMVKNALEAVKSGTTIRLRAARAGDRIQFSVWNPGAMPAAAQHQVFQRAFSTKGSARGLGTYGMRLLTERYLHGRVWFESTVADGTRFVAEVPMKPPEGAIKD